MPAGGNKLNMAHYKLKRVRSREASYYELKNSGYILFEDARYYYSVYRIKLTGRLDHSTWARLNACSMERETPIFTREFCECNSIKNCEFDTIDYC